MWGVKGSGPLLGRARAPTATQLRHLPLGPTFPSYLCSPSTVANAVRGLLSLFWALQASPPVLRRQMSEWERVIEAPEEDIVRRAQEANWLRGCLWAAEWETVERSRHITFFEA